MAWFLTKVLYLFTGQFVTYTYNILFQNENSAVLIYLLQHDWYDWLTWSLKNISNSVFVKNRQWLLGRDFFSVGNVLIISYS